MDGHWRGVVALNAALVVLLTAAGPASAAGWGPTTILNASRAFTMPGALARNSASVVGAIYADQQPSLAYRIYFRRSTDGGATWQPAVALSATSAQAADPSLGVSGSTFHAVWTEIVSGKVIVRYARSLDGGVTWVSKKSLSSSGESAYTPRVAGDGAGRVAVVWASSPAHLYARVSSDSGATFASRKTISNSIGSGATLPVVGIGRNGKLHVAYNDGGIAYTRSAPDADHWSAPVQLASGIDGGIVAPAMAVSGPTLMVGYNKRSAAGDFWVQYRRSVNNGADWDAPKNLSTKAAADTHRLVMSARGGTWRAAFERCTNTICSASEVFVRKSTNKGDSWSSAKQASPGGGEALAQPMGVDGGAKTVIVWRGLSNDGSVSLVRARRET